MNYLTNENKTSNFATHSFKLNCVSNYQTGPFYLYSN